MILAAQVFGSKHLIGLLIVITLVLLSMFLVEKKNVSQKKVLLVVTIGLLVIEITKLTFITINAGSFPMNHLPLHLCSLPLYLYPIIAFSKNEKLKKFVLPAAYATVLFGGLIALLYPANILGSEETWTLTKDNFLPYISFVYHGLMIFGPIYLLRSGMYTISIPKLKVAFIVTFIFMLMAMTVNTYSNIVDSFGVKDFMLLNTGNGSPFVFIRDINLLLYTVSMILIGFFAVALFHMITYAIVGNKSE